MSSAQEHETPPEETGADAPAGDAPVAEGEAVAAETEGEPGANGANGENGDAAKNGKNGAPGVVVDENGYFRAGNPELWVAAKGEFAEKDLSGYVPTPESDELRVELNLFDGPLDLLLHLLDRHAFDIFDIPIARITEEYLKVLDDMRSLNLDIAGEFLVMASRLAHIKSKMLLPPDPSELDEEEDGIDPRLELVRRLLEYQRFKEVAEQLGELPQLGRDTFARARHRPDVDTANPDDPLGTGLVEFDVIELIGVFEEILKRSKKKIVHEVIAERLSVGARINELVDFARSRQHFTFRDVVEQFGEIGKRNVIVTFLAVLEMARLKLLRIHQPDDSQIYITPIAENLSEEPGDVESDFDTEDEQAAQKAEAAGSTDESVEAASESEIESESEPATEPDSTTDANPEPAPDEDPAS